MNNDPQHTKYLMDQVAECFAMTITISWPKHYWEYVVRAQKTSGGKVA